MPFERDCDLLVKKVTVTGIIGNTHGVIKAINPPKKPKIKMEKIPWFWVASSPQLFTGFFISIAADLIFIPVAIPPSSAVLNSNGMSCPNSSPLL